MPVWVDKKFNIWTKTAACDATSAGILSAGLKVDVEAVVSATLNYGVALTGTIVPPAISDFAIVAGFEADLTGKLSLDILANVGVTTILLPLASDSQIITKGSTRQRSDYDLQLRLSRPRLP